MAGLFKINGATLPVSGLSAPYVFDPRDQNWGREGDEIITHSRKKSSLAQTTIEVVWPFLTPSNAGALFDYYYEVIIPADCQIASITVPPRNVNDTGSLGTWKEYTGVDNEPIIVDEPTFEYAGIHFRTIRWRFHGLGHVLES